MAHRMNSGPAGGQSDPSSTGNRPKQPRMSGRSWMVLLGFVLLFNIVFYYVQLNSRMASKAAQTTLSYSTFTSQVKSGNIKDANVDATEITGAFKKPYPKDGKKYDRYSTIITTDLTKDTVA